MILKLKWEILFPIKCLCHFLNRKAKNTVSNCMYEYDGKLNEEIKEPFWLQNPVMYFYRF